MFTGLIEEIGLVRSLKKKGGGLEIDVGALKVTGDLKPGDSIALNGVCLTVEDLNSSSFKVTAVQETLERSTLSGMKTGQRVNLERSLKAGDRLGGHFVQGHVDGVGEITSIFRDSGTLTIKVKLPASLPPFVVENPFFATQEPLP
jgi:riboflavin synthase